MKRTVNLLVVCASLLVGQAAHADPSPTGQEVAQRHFDAGRAEVRAGRCDLAVPRFQQSVAAAPNVGALLNLGECLETLGRLEDAYEALRGAQTLAAELRDDRLTVARASAERVESKAVRVVVRPPAGAEDVTVELDGAPVPRVRWLHILVTPNEPHRLVALAPGRPMFAREVAGRAGESFEIAIEMATAPAAARVDPIAPRPPRATAGPSPLRTAGFITGGVGAAALVGGAIFGILTFASRSDLSRAVASDPRCVGVYPSSVCDPSARSNLAPIEDRAQTQASIATVLFVAGSAALAAGVALVVLAPSTKTIASVRVAPHPRGAVAELTW
jgi:hypothetical protein